MALSGVLSLLLVTAVSDWRSTSRARRLCAPLEGALIVPRGKGNPRCMYCEGRGIVHGPRGYAVCECRRGKPNYAVLAKLAALKAPDFITYLDEYDALIQQGVDPHEASDTAYARSLDA